MLAKVDVDQNQQSAQAFGVRGIPAVKAFVDAEIVDEFTGALPRPKIEAWLEGIVPSEADARIVEAAELEEEGNLDAAAAIYRSLLDSRPDHPQALIGMARVAAATGRPDEAADYLEQVPLGERGPHFEAMALDIEAAQLPPREQLERRIGEDANDLEARYQLGVQLAAQRSWDAALEQLLQIVIRNRQWRDDLGRETMVRIFQIMGPDTDEVRQWQKKLGRAMY